MSLATGFATLSVLVAFGFVASIYWVGERKLYRLIVISARMLTWLALTGAVAAAGYLRFWPPPPTFPLLALLSMVLVVVIVRSSLGDRLVDGLPLWWLVGFQVFRIPVELLLHQAYLQGHIGIQMTYLDRNLDVLSGITGLFLGVILYFRPTAPSIVLGWNVLGLGLLINIVTIAMLSAPTPLRHFVEGPANIFVTQFPYVWLPTILVQAALLGHLLVFKKLWRQARAETTAAEIETNGEGRS